LKTVIFVNGIPKAQPRPRLTTKGKGKSHVFNPSSADVWKNEVWAACLNCRKQTITGPVRLTVRFSFPVPKGMEITKGAVVPHITKPDTDNLLKAVMDAMTAANVWKDDAQVFETIAGKYYTGKETGAQIIVESEW